MYEPIGIAPKKKKKKKSSDLQEQKKPIQRTQQKNVGPITKKLHAVIQPSPPTHNHYEDINRSKKKKKPQEYFKPKYLKYQTT